MKDVLAMLLTQVFTAVLWVLATLVVALSMATAVAWIMLQ